jgi:redox-sensitive bicupin YhaK (pirin superfamily)
VIIVRPSSDRLHTRIGWLESRHTFSFAEHYDPRYMGYRALRVLNEDWIAPGQGFGMHPHRDLEIITVVLEGSLRHDDSLGTSVIATPGDVQRITAGTGLLHSEFNASLTDRLHLIQLWITPEKSRLQPGYERRHIPAATNAARWRIIASRAGREGSVTVHQDVHIFASLLHTDEHVEYPLAPERHAWVQVIRGAITVNDVTLHYGDGASITAEALSITAACPAEFLLIDLA